MTVRGRDQEAVRRKGWENGEFSIPAGCFFLEPARGGIYPRRSMNHRDEEITDVVVVLDTQRAQSIQDACEALKLVGLAIDEIKDEEGVIEGSICADKVPHLKSVIGVAYVRSVFTYTADYPVGDPRDLDGAEESTETDDD